MKGNAYRKEFYIDRFSRRFCCQHHRLNKLRYEKKAARRTVRRNAKKVLSCEQE